MKRAAPHRAAALAELGALLPLAMVGLLLANDRLLKLAFHNALTGKLSDVAICFLMPLLVSATLGLIFDWSARRRLCAGGVVTVIVFSALEMSDLAGAWFSHALAILLPGQRIVLTRDPTDLLALGCVPLAIIYGLRRARAGAPHPRWASVAGALALITGSLALVATSAPYQCADWSAPVVFSVDGDCGAGGLVVVEADRYGGQLTITNAPALLTPLPAGSSNDATRLNQRFTGASCPYTLDRGEWFVSIGTCSNFAPPPPPLSVDAGVAADANALDGASDAGGLADASDDTNDDPNDGGAAGTVGDAGPVGDAGTTGRLRSSARRVIGPATPRSTPTSSGSPVSAPIRPCSCVARASRCSRERARVAPPVVVVGVADRCSAGGAGAPRLHRSDLSRRRGVHRQRERHLRADDPAIHADRHRLPHLDQRRRSGDSGLPCDRRDGSAFGAAAAGGLHPLWRPAPVPPLPRATRRLPAGAELRRRRRRAGLSGHAHRAGP